MDYTVGRTTFFDLPSGTGNNGLLIYYAFGKKCVTVGFCAVGNPEVGLNMIVLKLGKGGEKFGSRRKRYGG